MSRARRRLRAAIPLATSAVLVAGMAAAPAAVAFKPYTHLQTGATAYADAIDDGQVTIDGTAYAVPPQVVEALRDWPAHYNAGVIGPDGFPDLTMGQSIIHPENTGQWLAFLLDKAWDAQDDDSYSADEKGQILAFTYGFLTHAAGDLWAHTMVNEFADGVFPAVGEILTDEDKAAIALRHLLVEGYVGAATEGWDNDPTRTQLPNGDVSDDATAAVPFDAPTRFIHNALVKRNNGSPTNARGPVIDYFLGLRADLEGFLDEEPDLLQPAIDAYNDTVSAVEAVFAPAQCDGVDNNGNGEIDEGCDGIDLLSVDEDTSGPCSFGAGDGSDADIAADIALDVAACGPALLVYLPTVGAIESAQAAHETLNEVLYAAAKPVLDAYVAAWIEDIDEGLKAWGELGLATTKGLFDPGTRRAAQNDECSSYGADQLGVDPDIDPRAVCENGIGMVDTVLWASDDFINDHLLSMLGAPDAIGDLREILEVIADELDSILGPTLNPLRTLNNAIEDKAKEIVKDALSERFGVDVDLIEDLLEDPTTRMDLTTINLGALGTVNVFPPDTRDKLDGYLGLASHDPYEPLVNGETFDPAAYKAFQNTQTLAKLLLLGNFQLDQVLSDLMGRPYELYAAGGIDPRVNIMTKTLPGVGNPEQWLIMIDGDHGWRSDRLPEFTDMDEAAGEGNFPLWESCVLRERGFRALFDDWENDDTVGIGDGDGQLDPVEDFPALGDEPSGDPNDPDAPESTLIVGEPKHVAGSTYVKSSTPLTLEATDGFWNDDELEIEYRVAGGAWTLVGDGAGFDLAGRPDGDVTVTRRAADPCGREADRVTVLTVDDTAPVITIASPLADPATYETDKKPLFSYSAVDAGSGVASTTGAIDGTMRSTGYELDLFLFTAGLHSASVMSVDHLGNSATTQVQFRVRATSASLLNNLNRARDLGLVTDPKVYKGLKDKLDAAIAAHAKGQHATEWNQLGAWIDQLLAQRGKGIDAATADRFIGYAQDLISAKG